MASPKDQVKRWVGIATGIWVQALAGNGNVFPHFAPTLKHQLHLNQVELNNLGVAKDFGDSVGLVAGMLSNLLSPWIILLIGALEGLVGFGTLWLVMRGFIAPLPYWQVRFVPPRVSLRADLRPSVLYVLCVHASVHFIC